MVDPAAGDVGDLVRAGLEDPDLRRGGAPAHREPRARAKAERCADRRAWKLETRAHRERGQPLVCGQLDPRSPVARAAGAGRSVGTRRDRAHGAEASPIDFARLRLAARRCTACSLARGGPRSASRSRTAVYTPVVMRRSPPPPAEAFLPTTAGEIRARGWDAPDVVLVSGDAYIDHPSFAAAILGRWLEANGFRVAILAQPDWKSVDAFRALGRPRLFYGVSAGNMDSLINHYTANKKRRNADAYSPGGEIGLRPDRATAVYAQRCREAFPGVPVIAGGVEASLRRIAHYDYWSDKVWPSILVTSKAHLLVYGMGETPILEIARRLDAGGDSESLRDLRGVAYLLGKSESIPAHRWDDANCPNEDVTLPSFERVTEDKVAFAEMTRDMHRETNPLNARRLLQSQGERTLVVNPPSLSLSEAQMDALYDLPYTRRPHPSYDAEVPAWQTIRDSVQIMRGCFGGCTFCSITMHQGRAIQSRSPESILREVESLAATPGFSGHVSDLGGPTANMYRMRCTKPDVEAVCRRLSCIHPTVCKLLGTSHEPTLELLRAARAVPGVKQVHVASGIRMDLAREAPE